MATIINGLAYWYDGRITSAQNFMNLNPITSN